MRVNTAVNAAIPPEAIFVDQVGFPVEVNVPVTRTVTRLNENVRR